MLSSYLIVLVQIDQIDVPLVWLATSAIPCQQLYLDDLAALLDNLKAAYLGYP